MLVLALDTTTRRGSVALARDGALVECYVGDPAVTHGQRLPGDLARVLERHGAGPADVDLFAVAAGPGSFTGLRIGIATMQGLALAGNRSLIGVSALDALNAAARVPIAGSEGSSVGAAWEVAAWMDAQRGEVFSALYAEGRVIDGPTVETPRAVLARWRSRVLTAPLMFAGDGANTYDDLIRRELPSAHVLGESLALAPSVAALAEAAFRDRGPAAPDEIRPLYVRRPDAELARDRARDAGAVRS